MMPTAKAMACFDRQAIALMPGTPKKKLLCNYREALPSYVKNLTIRSSDFAR